MQILLSGSDRGQAAGILDQVLPDIVAGKTGDAQQVHTGRAHSSTADAPGIAQRIRHRAAARPHYR